MQKNHRKLVKTNGTHAVVQGRVDCNSSNDHSSVSIPVKVNSINNNNEIHLHHQCFLCGISSLEEVLNCVPIYIMMGV